MKKSELFFGALRIPVDFVATVLAFLTAKELRLHPTLLSWLQEPAKIAPEFGDFLRFAIACSAGLILIFAINKLYSLRTSAGFSKELRKIIFLVSAWVMLITAYFFLTREFFFSRLVLAYAWFFAIIFVSLGRSAIRIIQNLLLRMGVGVRRLAIIGTNTNSLLLGETLSKNPRYCFLGWIEAGELDPKFPKKPLGLLAEFEKLSRQNRIEEIIVASRKLRPEETRELLAHCREQHIDFHFVPDLLEVPQKNVEIEMLRGIPIISLLPTPLSGWGRIGKRIFDLGGASLALIATSPIWLSTMLAIKLDSPGPIFFSKKDDGSPVYRVGRHGKIFRFIKFRSMQTGTDSERYGQLAQKSHRAGPLVKIANDPRITRIGSFLRHYSIDELPQLLLVLKGDMSLVGPRPHLPEEVARYAPHHRRVLSIKPGITGLAQVSGRSDLDFEDEVRLDTWYIENWSPWLDLKILWKTAGVVLWPRHRE